MTLTDLDQRTTTHSLRIVPTIAAHSRPPKGETSISR